MIETLAHTAVSGLGLSAGRDAYQQVKKGNIFLYAIAALFLLVWGYRGLVRNVGNPTRNHAFLRLFGSVIAIALGNIILFGITHIVLQGRLGDMIAILSGLNGLFVVVGWAWGRSQKNSDIADQLTEEHNIQFMHDNGLRDSQFETDVIEDEEGNKLRVKEMRDDAIVFSVIGRRGLRAMITLDNGRMVDYSGVVRL